MYTYRTWNVNVPTTPINACMVAQRANKDPENNNQALLLIIIQNMKSKTNDCASEASSNKNEVIKTI